MNEEISDTERLEWLVMGEGRDGFKIESDHEGCYIYHFKGSHKGYFNNYRDAIDAAISELKKRGVI
jgi:hypothetical protein